MKAISRRLFLGGTLATALVERAQAWAMRGGFNSVQIYLVDDSGNILTDDSGNRLLAS